MTTSTETYQQTLARICAQTIGPGRGRGGSQRGVSREIDCGVAIGGIDGRGERRGGRRFGARSARRGRNRAARGPGMRIHRDGAHHALLRRGGAGSARGRGSTARGGAGDHLSTLAFSEEGSRSHFWAPLGTARAEGATSCSMRARAGSRRHRRPPLTCGLPSRWRRKA